MVPIAIPVIIVAKAFAAGFVTGVAVGAGMTHAKAKKEMERIHVEVKKKLGN